MTHHCLNGNHQSDPKAPCRVRLQIGTVSGIKLECLSGFASEYPSGIIGIRNLRDPNEKCSQEVCGTAAQLQDEGDIGAGGKRSNLPHFSNVRVDRNVTDSSQIGFGDAISEQEHCLLWIRTFGRPDQAMCVQPALVNGRCPLGDNVIISGFRVYEIRPADTPLGQIRSEKAGPERDRASTR